VKGLHDEKKARGEQKPFLGTPLSRGTRKQVQGREPYSVDLRESQTSSFFEDQLEKGEDNGDPGVSIESLQLENTHNPALAEAGKAGGGDG